VRLPILAQVDWPSKEYTMTTKVADPLEQYPYLRACLEDHSLAQKLSKNPEHARASVCLMHDSIEFLLYEILVHLDFDIYVDGQHTIGFNDALDAAKKLNVNVPLLGTVRAIQKLRGDAKHHAQRPDAAAFTKLDREFNIVISTLVHENFGEPLGEVLRSFDLSKYHQGLFDCYRKYRNHNWNFAVRNSIGALVYKHRELLNLSVEYISGRDKDPYKLIQTFEKDIAIADYPAARDEILRQVRDVPNVLREFLGKKDEKGAAEHAGKVYSRIDEILPSNFDIATAHKLTPKLMQPKGGIIGGGSWSKWQASDSSETKQALQGIAEFLKAHPAIVKTFGHPFDMDDDDRIWRFWEFAIFDGERWSSFHLDHNVQVSLESQPIMDEAPARRENLAKAIQSEFASLGDRQK
jgi:hypothetical protein